MKLRKLDRDKVNNFFFKTLIIYAIVSLIISIICLILLVY